MNINLETSVADLVLSLSHSHTHIFGVLNILNWKLVGSCLNIIPIIQFRHLLQSCNFQDKSKLYKALQDSTLDQNLREMIQIYLQQFEPFCHYFPNLTAKTSKWKLIQSPFQTLAKVKGIFGTKF